MIADIPDINSEMIIDLINEHQYSLLPRYMKLQKIYEGKHSVLERIYEEGKPNNKLIIDFPGYITKIMSGYFMGNPVAYNSINSETNEDEELLEKLQAIFRINNEHKQNTELSTDLSIKGEAFEILYINEDKGVEFVQIPAEEIIVKYESSFKKKMELALRYYSIKDITNNKEIKKVEVYTKDKIQFFTQVDEKKFILDNEIEHHFKEVPVIHYVNNKEKSGDWEKVMTLIDELESRLSDNSNELQAFRESYLVLKGVQMDAEQVRELRSNQALMLPDDSSVDFLTKNINDKFAENHLNRIIDLIHKMAMIPDISDDSFGNASSGISIKFKLYCMETITAIKESYFKESLLKRVQLITNYINYTELKNYNYSDLEIIFNRNIPANISEIIENSTKLSGIVSQETVISQIPFIPDVKEELRRMEREVDPYSMSLDESFSNESEGDVE